MSEGWRSGFIQIIRRYERNFNQTGDTMRLWMITLLGAIGYAFYTGFRAPSLWSINYYQVSYLDGFYRRGLLGVFLTPFGCARFDYFFVEKIQLLVLFLVIALFVYIAIKSRSFFALIVLFCSAAGGYLFHEVGYVDQLLWIFAAMAIGLLERNYLFLAALLLCLSVLIHEMSVFTIVPIVLAYAVVRKKLDGIAYAKLLIPPVALFLVISLFFQAVSFDTIKLYFENAMNCGSPIVRKEYFKHYLQPFRSESNVVYYSWQQFYMAILPIIVLACTLVLAIRKRLGLLRLQTLLILACCISPLSLGLFVADTSRWIFLGFAQVVIVSIIASWALRRNGFRNTFPGIPFAIALVLVGGLLQLTYFDHFSPRTLSPDNLRAFPNYVVEQLFNLPRPL